MTPWELLTQIKETLAVLPGIASCQIGLEAIPPRARPVPFWRHGLRVDLAISLRSFCARLPLRALAR